MADLANSAVNANLSFVADEMERDPDISGKSKLLWRRDGGDCIIKLIPSLRSFTSQRDEIVSGTETLRLDFYEMTAERMRESGIPCAFRKRISADTYLAEYVPAPPIEVIVKNRAVGSTVRKYPGLFEEGSRLPRPIVKFDYRCDPEDQPIGEDYLRSLDLPVDEMRSLALKVNDLLRSWMEPVEVWDFCLIFGIREDGELSIISEVSQDCMRLRMPDGSPVDKDLFREGASGESILREWKRLFDEIS